MGLAGASLRVVLLRLVSLASWALVGVLTARVLSVSERGVYATAVLTAEIGASIAGSFSAGCIQQIATGKGSTATILRTGLRLGALIGVGAFAVAVLAWLAWPDNLGFVVLLVGTLFLPGILRGMLGGALIATGRVGRAQIAGNSGVFLGLVFIAAWFIGPGTASAETALLMWTVAQYASVLIAASFCSRWLFSRGDPVPGLVRHVLTFGSVAGMAGIVGLIQRRVDLLLVAGLSGSHDAGLYSAATSLAELLLVVPGATAVAAVWRVGRESDEEARRVLALCSRQAVLLGACASLGIIVLGPIGLRVAFGPDYTAATSALRVLAVAAVFIAPQSVVGTYFYVRLARPAITLYVITGAAMVEFVLAFALIPAFGLVGAATSDAVAYGLEAIGMTIAIRRLAGVSVRELWVPTADDLAMDLRAVARVLRGRPVRPELTAVGELE